MVTRRRYRDGGRVPVQESSARADVSPPTPAPSATADDDAVLSAASAAHRADQLQRDLAEANRKRAEAEPDFESRISKLPENARSWLREHPEMIHDPALNDQLGAVHSYLVKSKRLPEFSREYFDAMDAEFGFQRQARPDNAVLHREAPPAVLEPKRSMPIAAPVSREIPTSAGQRYSSSRITLSPEEIDMAHRSFRHLPTDQAEFEYARNKARMIQLKAAGVIQGDG